MKSARLFFVAASIFAAEIFFVAAQSSNSVTTLPVYVPDYSRAGEPMRDGIFAWDGVSKSVDVTNGEDFARFTFDFTNVTSGNVTILSVKPSCGCTTAELPPVPWTIPAGSSGEMKVSVNLAGKDGVIYKSVNVATDQGNKNLVLRVNILPAPVAPPLTAEQMAHGIAAAKVDRQAIFKGDCASCHVPKNTETKYGEQLYAAVCAICHDAFPRATMVPDLHNLKAPTELEFWRTWITLGKPGSLMPAFASAQGGPLNDMQIASLAQYLNSANPSHAAPTQ